MRLPTSKATSGPTNGSGRQQDLDTYLEIPNLLGFAFKQHKSYQDQLELKVMIYSLLNQEFGLIGKMNHIYIMVLRR